MNKHQVFGTCCNFLAHLGPRRQGHMTIIEKHNTGGTGNLYDVRRELLQLRPELTFHYIYHSDYTCSGFSGFLRRLRLFTTKAYWLMHSECILLNDNFLPLAYLRLAPKTQVVQLWHGVGAFKQFGLSSETDPQVISMVQKGNQKLTSVIVSSKNCISCYEEAFGVPAEKIFPLGSPQTDAYFVPYDRDALLEAFYRAYPRCRGKKLVLYAPTFRGDEAADRALCENFDFMRFHDTLGEDYELLVRLHPQVHHSAVPADAAIDVTDYPSIRELLQISDCYIGDYSSVAVEFALLHKPIYLFPFDYDTFLAKERQFYFDYLEQAPGPVCYTMKELLDALRAPSYDYERLERFAALHNDFTDGLCARRVAMHILNAAADTPQAQDQSVL